MQSWRKLIGEMWDNGQLRPRYDEYQWRDYHRDNINGDGRSRYQLWLNDRWTYQIFDPKFMQTDKQKMINATLAAEKKGDTNVKRMRPTLVCMHCLGGWRLSHLRTWLLQILSVLIIRTTVL
jgi:hypothetical protein